MSKPSVSSPDGRSSSEALSTHPTASSSSPSLPSWVRDGKLVEDELKAEIGRCTEELAREGNGEEEHIKGAERLYQCVMQIWSLEAGELPRRAADIACDEIRLNGGLDKILHLLCSSSNPTLTITLTKGLEQVMVSENRVYIATHHLFNCVVKVVSQTDIPKLMVYGTGVLENLFKESSKTCLALTQNGGLEAVVHACRVLDTQILRHCAAALANCAIYGSLQCHDHMIHSHVDNWLFPLANSNDDVVKYYALLGITQLAANPAITDHVAQSGTLDLVMPFLHSQNPEEFATGCPSHAHGRSQGWLSKLKPLLVCECEEARSMAAFHFAMEALIKQKQDKLEILNAIEIADHLQMAAKKGSKLIAGLCCKALSIINAPLPTYQSWNVLRWHTYQVQAWASDIGLVELVPNFSANLVDGNILVDLTVKDLLEIGANTSVKAKWIIAQIKKLRRRADVSALDRDNISTFLTDIHPELAVYRVDFARRQISPDFVPHLKEDILIEVGVHSIIDRARILQHVEGFSSSNFDEEETKSTQTVHTPLLPKRLQKNYDVFISYRRESGSLLASLLKVHLHMRGLSAFLDVTSLGRGKFDDALLTIISQCSNVVLILTENCLQRCLGDQRIEDWLHKELVWALEHKVNIVPLVEAKFKWPTNEALPSDIQPLSVMNGVNWSHEYQDASVSKLLNFFKLPPLLRRNASKGGTQSYRFASQV